MQVAVSPPKVLPNRANRTLVARIDLTRVFWIGLGALTLTLVFTAHPQSNESLIGALMIIAAAWLPAYFWARRKMTGLPIFPLFALTHTWTFGLPLLYEHPIVSRFESSDQLIAAISVTGFLLVSTLVWMKIRAPQLRMPTYCLCVGGGRADSVFFCLLGLSIVFTMAMNGGWLNFAPGVFSIIRSLILALQALSCFVLSYRLGAGELTGVAGTIFRVLIVLLVVITLPSLTMIGAMAIVALSSFGYVAGSGKMPWGSFGIAVVMFAFLQAGKGEMREQYWGEADQGPVQPWEYPVFFGEWFSASAKELNASKEIQEEKSSLMERASLMQLLLHEQTLSGSIPFLYGETYAIVPQMLIPRILFPGRATTHEGTYRLSIHYGFQTREETETTTIGFGLINEAYANFGLAGMAMLAVFLGLFYGEMERLSASVPILSFKGMFAVVIASYCFQTEFAAGVYAAAVSQSTVALILLSLLIMRRHRNPLAPTHLSLADQNLCKVPSS